MVSQSKTKEPRSNSRKIDILIVFCGAGNALGKGGGGFTRTINILKHLSQELNISFITSYGGRGTLKGLGLQLREVHLLRSYLFQPKEKLLFSRVPAYLLSTLHSLFVVKDLPKTEIIFSVSDGFWDTIPAFLYKKSHPQTIWVSTLYHQIGVRKDNLLSLLVTLSNNFMKRIGQQFILKGADAVFLLNSGVGQKIKSELHQKGFQGKVYLVDGGIDFNLIQQVKPKGEKKYTACFAGGLRPSKGLYDLIPIWQEVTRYQKEAKLLLIGGINPLYQERFNRSLQETKLADNIEQLGFLDDHTEVFSWMKTAKLFLFPSHEEGWGIAIAEAMACGLPVITWGLPDYETTFPQGMLTIKEGNIKGMASLIHKVLSDDKLATSISQQGSELVKEYNWTTVAKKELKILKELVR